MNNFINNIQHVEFKLFWLQLNTKWRGNYWDEPYSSPKIIKGKVVIIIKRESQEPWDIIYELSFPWIGIDWNPAQEPYDI